jgi:2-polyprenyl-3-methyl-5-hydroxy-6-metoxy-1,4-benzoquinol methylase
LTAATSQSGSARSWGPRWGARADDWAANEELQVPTYAEAIRRVGREAGERVLDVGCGSGVFLRLAADRGARVFGLDASEALSEHRNPTGGYRLDNEYLYLIARAS